MQQQQATQQHQFQQQQQVQATQQQELLREFRKEMLQQIIPAIHLQGVPEGHASTEGVPPPVSVNLNKVGMEDDPENF